MPRPSVGCCRISCWCLPCQDTEELLLCLCFMDLWALWDTGLRLYHLVHYDTREFKVHHSQAKILEKLSLHTQLLDCIASHVLRRKRWVVLPWEGRREGGVQRPEGLGGQPGRRQKVCSWNSQLSPQAWPPTVPGEGQGGQHFPSQPGVSSPGMDTPVVWTGSPGNLSHMVLSGKSLAPGHLHPFLSGPLSPTQVSHHRPFLWHVQGPFHCVLHPLTQ